MNKTLTLLMLLPGILVACNQDEKLSSVINQADLDHTHVQQVDLSQDSSGFIGKPHAPISMNYEFLNHAELNSDHEIRLTFTLQQDSELLEVVYKTSENLKSIDPVQQQVFTRPEKGAEHSFLIHVVAEKAGLSYVNVFASIIMKGKKQSRSFAIPIKIERLKTDADLAQQKSTPDQKPSRNQREIKQNVISMPAVESDQMGLPHKN